VCVCEFACLCVFVLSLVKMQTVSVSWFQYADFDQHILASFSYNMRVSFVSVSVVQSYSYFQTISSQSLWRMSFC
jgi:hypothetical protein